MDAQKQTKKQKKAQVFRANKGKGKKESEQIIDLPETEDLDAQESLPIPSTSALDTVSKGEKKRKRTQEDTVTEGNGEGGAEVGTGGDAVEGEDKGEEVEGERKKKRQRGKKPSERKAAALAEGKPRLVLFVGNLPFKITTEEIQAHFKPCGETPIVRLLTPKPSPTATATALARTKGCAFIEFTSPLALQAALRLHEEELLGRKLNVELTAGGGGKSTTRLAKLADKRATLTEERARTKKNKAEREGVVPVEDTDKTGRWKKEVVEPVEKVDKNGKKVRDRRLVKPVDQAAKEKERAKKTHAWASSGANSITIG